MKNGLCAAVGKVKITPEELAPLQGYDPAEYIADPTKDILDDLYARILILEDASCRCMIVSVDSCFTNEQEVMVADPEGRPGGHCREFGRTFPEGTREEWAEAASANVSSVTLNATHTHSAPAFFSEKYISRITAKIKEMSGLLVPVKVSVGRGACELSANRRPTLHVNLTLPVDQTLDVIVLETMQGTLMSAIVNYAVHPTILRNPYNRVSSECIGWAMKELEQEIGKGFVPLFTQGFSGDICPIFPGHAEEIEDTYPNVNKAGSMLYQDIKKVINQRQEIAQTSLSTAQKIVDLPTRKGFFKPQQQVTLMAIVIGDIALLSVSGEVFNGYVDKIRALSPFRHTLLSGLANGYAGYLPTNEAFHDGLGGYEMNTTPFDERLDELFVQAAVQCLNDLKGI